VTISESPIATPIFDEAKLARMRDALGGDALDAMLSDVPDESVRLLKELQAAIAAGDFKTASDCAHTIKGLASNFAATRIAELARDVENEVKQTGSFSSKLDNLEDAIDETREWIARSA
jgi:HPt (histidine-containing phosphotransfer) domain-containing protein